MSVEDERLYVVRYNAYSSNNARSKYVNTTELSCIVNDLKPNTQYEFSVKLIKVFLIINHIIMYIKVTLIIRANLKVRGVYL